jgi:hypothetical protein
MPEVTRLPRVDLAHQAGHLLRRRPGVQGPEARADGAGLRLRAQALCRPRQYLAQLALGGRMAHRRPGGAARARAEGQEALRLRRESRACARSTATRCSSRSSGRAALRREPHLGADLGAVAREVVEFYGDKIMEHPVGTGPFRLAQWRRSSRSCSSATPTSARSATTPSPRPLPTMPRARPSCAHEGPQAAAGRPRRGLHHRGGAAALAELPQRPARPAERPVPQEFVPTAMPGGKLAPNLARAGMQAWRVMRPRRS